MRKNDLLKKALARHAPTRTNFKANEKQIELALAWVEDKVGIVDVGYALGLKQAGNAYVFLARTLKQVMKESK